VLAAAAVWSYRVGLWLASAVVNRLYYTPDVASAAFMRSGDRKVNRHALERVVKHL
jgi:hypothetical protein